ncbi:hypothetical protein JCGZ_05777 [Jatropha curcas]|uniref:Voltage-gated hydrogen channel 1 n=2 Tax=Jatropha curcas TaxID=180498 RepID=A0A067L074_JATCU|nr:hypothetical protein JCGZ_05777 [Jatropha curcas]
MQQSNPASINSNISIESIESSVQTLIKSWYRRQKWKLFFNPTDEQSQNTINEAKWRRSMTKFLESTPVRAISVFLLLLDLILTVLELSSSLLSCSPQKNTIEKQVWYHWVGIAILSLLSAKAIALAVALGGSFFRRPGYVVDGVVVGLALLLEALLEKKGGALIVVVSLWRVVRVVESAFELSDEAIEAQIEGIVCQFEILREENARLLEIIADKDVVINKLQEMIDKLQSECDQCRE